MSPKLLSLAIIAASLAGSPSFAQAALAAQAAPTPRVGMQVVDTKGRPVGMVTAMKGGNLIVRTDRLEATLPASSFTVQDGKLWFAMTRDQLNASIEAAAAAAEAALAPGASVKGAEGHVIGTIEAIDQEFATIKTVGGKMIKVPRAGIAASGDGAVIGMTAEQLEAVLAQTKSE